MQINKPTDVLALLRPYGKRKQENFGVICMDYGKNVISKKVLFIGTAKRAIIGARELLTYVLKKGADTVILFHNHPSGVTEPSAEDIETTKKLNKAFELVGVQLLDHIIITKYAYKSFLEDDLLNTDNEATLKVAQRG